MPLEGDPRHEQGEVGTVSTARELMERAECMLRHLPEIARRLNLKPKDIAWRRKSYEEGRADWAKYVEANPPDGGNWGLLNKAFDPEGDDIEEMAKRIEAEQSGPVEPSPKGYALLAAAHAAEDAQYGLGYVENHPKPEDDPCPPRS
jgi:hypothetical protein